MAHRPPQPSKDPSKEPQCSYAPGRETPRQSAVDPAAPQEPAAQDSVHITAPRAAADRAGLSALCAARLSDARGRLKTRIIPPLGEVVRYVIRRGPRSDHRRDPQLGRASPDLCGGACLQHAGALPEGCAPIGTRPALSELG